MIPPRVSSNSGWRGVVWAVVLALAAHTASAEILIKNGEEVGFLGDSITASGWGNPAGYVKLVVAGLAANGVKIEPAPAGIGGHKSNNLLNRLDRDVLSKKPQWMTLSCGVNDVLQGKKGVPLNDAQAAATNYEKSIPSEPEKGTFESNITQIVDRAQAAGVKVIILTTTVIKEDLASRENQQLVPYNDFLRRLAIERQLPLADLNALFREKIKAANQPKKNVFTTDGVHMNTEGNKLMAIGVLRTMGLDDDQIQRAREAWLPLETLEAEIAKRAAEAKARLDAEKAARDAAIVAPAK